MAEQRSASGAGGLDLVALVARLDAAAQSWRPGCVVDDLRTMEGGTVGLVFSAAVDGDERIVIKVAPPGLPPVRNRDMLRQARVITALHGHPGVGVPDVVFTDAGEPNDIPPLFATALVSGECKEPLLEAAREQVPAEIARGRGFAAARMLAAVHQVAPESVGLANETETSARDEVERWTRTFETVPDVVREGYEAAHDALVATVPPAVPSVVVHGDYRLGNMLAEGTEVRAIIDWEIWSRSDPRIDLTWFMFFTDEAGHPSANHGVKSNMPSDAELLDEYANCMGAAPVDLDWFHALTRYKEAATMALIAKHAVRRDPDTPMMAAFAAILPPMIDDARRRVS
jgi:aminoglycoside phosphotransferase (APT) family kinase protein